MVYPVLPADVPEEEPNCGALVFDTVSGAGLGTPEKCDNVGFIAILDR
jgi:hypothetical protein